MQSKSTKISSKLINFLSENGVSIYIGENLPISNSYPFDSINDLQTSHEEYRRLIFNSIKHLFVFLLSFLIVLFQYGIYGGQKGEYVKPLK